MPLPLFNIEIRITGSRSGKSGSEGEKIISTGQRATFGLTPALSRPHRKDGGIFDSGRGK
jgi:hypothetical protein